VTTPRILVDADACPVKDEIYRVAFRLNLAVVIVANARIRVPDHPLVSRMVVDDGFDAADDWIAGEAGPHASAVPHRGAPLADPAWPLYLQGADARMLALSRRRSVPV